MRLSHPSRRNNELRLAAGAGDPDHVQAGLPAEARLGLFPIAYRASQCDNARSIRRPRRILIVAGNAGESFRLRPAIRTQLPNVAALFRPRYVSDVLAVGRPGWLVLARVSLAQPYRPARRHVQNVQMRER